MRSWNREQHRATPDFSSKVDVMLNPETESSEKILAEFPQQFVVERIPRTGIQSKEMQRRDLFYQHNKDNSKNNSIQL